MPLANFLCGLPAPHHPWLPERWPVDASIPFKDDRGNGCHLVLGVCTRCVLLYCLRHFRASTEVGCRAPSPRSVGRSLEAMLLRTGGLAPSAPANRFLIQYCFGQLGARNLIWRT